MNRHMSAETGAWTILLVLGGVFGSSFLYTKVLVAAYGPMQLVAARVALGAITMAGLLAARGELPRPDRLLIAGGTIVALLDCVLPYALISWAAQSIDSSVTAVLVSTLPLFTALFASLLPAEPRLSVVKAVGLTFGFAGVVVLIGPGALDVRDGVGAAHMAVLGAAMCYGVAGVYSRVLLRSHTVMDLTVVKLTIGSVIAIAVAFAVEGAPADVPLNGHDAVALALLGVVSTGLGRAAYLWVIGTLGSVRASLVTYITPIVALLLGWAVLGEQIGAGTTGGLGLIVLGVAAASFGDGALRFVSGWQLFVGRRVPPPSAPQLAP